MNEDFKFGLGQTVKVGEYSKGFIVARAKVEEIGFPGIVAPSYYVRVEGATVVTIHEAELTVKN